MSKILMIILLIVFPVKSWSLDYDFSVGLGGQYGGLGTQLSINHNKSKYFVALGYPGMSIGMKSQFSDNIHHSWGVNAGKMYGILSSDTAFAAITYNYHFSGFNRKGWELGTGLSYFKQDEYVAIFANEPKPEKEGFALLINVGYVF